MKTNTYTVNTKELRKIMIDKNISSIAELSEKSGVGRATLSKMINGQVQPSFGVLLKVADALSMSPETAGKVFFYRELT